MKPNKVLVLVGSPKGKNSVSNNIATYVQDKFEQNGLETRKTFIARHVKEEKLEKLVYEIGDFNLLILVTPLYVDSLPSIVIRLMEEIYEHKKMEKDNKQKLMAIINSGFPEPHHNDLAVDMCKNFAFKSHIEWIGGVKIGMGPALDSGPLKQSGRISQNLRNNLDIIVDYLSKNRQVPEEIFNKASKPLMPLFLSKFMLRWFGGKMWVNMAEDEHVKKNMRYRPYKS